LKADCHNGYTRMLMAAAARITPHRQCPTNRRSGTHLTRGRPSGRALSPTVSRRHPQTHHQSANSWPPGGPRIMTQSARFPPRRRKMLGPLHEDHAHSQLAPSHTNCLNRHDASRDTTTAAGPRCSDLRASRAGPSYPDKAPNAPLATYPSSSTMALTVAAARPRTTC
jgi:hypothetical protein